MIGFGVNLFPILKFLTYFPSKNRKRNGINITIQFNEKLKKHFISNDESSEEISFISDKESDVIEREYGDCDEPSSPSHSLIIHSSSYDDAVTVMQSVFSKVKRCPVASFPARIHQQGKSSLDNDQSFGHHQYFLDVHTLNKLAMSSA